MMLKRSLVFLLLSLVVAFAWAKPPGPPHGGKGPPPPQSPYARIHFDRGHGGPKLDIDCGAQTSIKDCADVANKLLDKMADMPAPPPKPPKP